MMYKFKICFREEENGNIIVVFPFEMATVNPLMVEIFSEDGGSVASAEYIKKRTKPCKTFPKNHYIFSLIPREEMQFLRYFPDVESYKIRQIKVKKWKEIKDE